MLRLALFLAFLAVPAHAEEDPLAAWGLSESTGAAAGYVADSACAECHADKAETYADMGMAKSFQAASGADVIEDFSALPFFHAPSQRWYDVRLDNGDYIFRRWRIAPDGTEVDVWERKADWIVGSGHHVRTFLFQTTDGALFQIPLAWYTQGGYWEMNPGFEHADHQGVNRDVVRRCMACHNALPEVPEGSDAAGQPEVFPHELPEGLGCQRCHGPGAEHVRAALSGAEVETVRAEIVQPGKLPKDRLYSICYGCHMQPTVAINAPLRGGRGIYSFRPGQDVNDYLTHIDIIDANRPKADRFEINFHPYRMEQSACFQQSQGELGCLTCHNPHVKIKPAERAAHYRQACLSCHETDDQALPVMASGVHPQIEAEADCTTCHMPERRTQDVIHVTMTDHRIQRDPGDLGALTAMIPKVPAEVISLGLLRDGSLSETETVIQNRLAILSGTGRQADYAVDALEAALKASDWPHADAWLELAKAQMALERYPAALSSVREVLARNPGNPEALNIRAVAFQRLDLQEPSLSVFDEALRATPDNIKLLFNKAVVLARADRFDEARPLVQKIIALRENHWPAYRLLAQIESAEGASGAAIEAYLQTLAIKPDAPATRAPMIELLKQNGRAGEAARHVVP
ncbi:tetratricopeptide repeat protein [Primorskyibacter sp. 2E107]|uniref:tetratricopeptide repeat protein n=1 Tax=Primorskyibacter sp. 2E107 TaxID=3403458 RepID=UPI003AF962EE